MKNNRKIAFLISGVLLSSSIILPVDGRGASMKPKANYAPLTDWFLEGIGLKETREEANARIYSEHYNAKIASGTPATYAKAYAEKIVAGYPATYAADYANQISLGKSATYAGAYASVKHQKFSDEFTEIFSQAYTDQITAGKSTAYADMYANQIAYGMTITYAIAYTDQITAGKSTAYAEMYATLKSMDKPEEHSVKYATNYADQIALGKSATYATNYAAAITSGYSVAFAKAYAEQITAGKSADYASNYADQIALGKPATSADRYAILVTSGKSATYSSYYSLMLNAGKSEIYAQTYAKAMDEGKSAPYAEGFARKTEEGIPEVYAKEYAELYAEQSMKGKNFIDADKFANDYIKNKMLLVKLKNDQKDAEDKLPSLEKDIKYYKDLFNKKCTPDDGVSLIIGMGAAVTVGAAGLVYANSGSSSTPGGGTPANIDNFNYDQYYVYHPVDTTEQNIVGLDTLSYLRDVFHAGDNLDHMGEHANEAHSLEERGHAFKEAAFVPKEGKKTYNMTFIDAIGMNAVNPQATYLNSTVKVSGLYLQNTNLHVRTNNTLTADALSVKNGTLAVNGTVSVGSFLLDSESTLTGGDKIELNAASSKQIIDHMKTNLPDRYAGAEYGKFDLRGTVGTFTAKKGMNVYLAPTSAANVQIDTLTHSGGTVVLSASKPTQVKDYKVTGPSVLSVNWDSTTQTAPLMKVTGTCDVGANLLGVKINSIPNGFLTKDATLKILSAPSITGTRATYNQELAGGTFEFKKDANTLTVTCTKATTSVAAATGLSTSLSADILGKSDSLVKGHFAALEIPTAVSALDAAVSDQYLSDVTPAPLSYFNIHQQAYTAGGWNGVDESSESTLTSMGINTGAAKLGISVSTPSIQTPSATPTVGAHLLSKDLFMDAFYTSGQNGVGSTFGWQHAGFHVGVSYMYDQRQGVSETNPMGRIEANNVNQHRILLNVGLNKRIETIDFSATAFAEALRFAQGYDVSINDEKFHINGHDFDRRCGLQLQAKANLDTGYISGAFGLSGSASKVEPTTSVSFSLSY